MNVAGGVMRGGQRGKANEKMGVERDIWRVKKCMTRVKNNVGEGRRWGSEQVSGNVGCVAELVKRKWRWKGVEREGKR